MIGGAATANRPQAQSSRVKRFRAPTSGMDVRRSLGDFDSPLNCVYAYNLLPFENGMQVRHGYREYVTGVDDGGSFGVHTLIPFNGVDGTNKLFAVNNEGIWDVTTYDTAPTKKVAFSTTTSDVGYGVYSHHVNDADNDVLFYADNVNGLFMYDVATDTWAVATGITGVTIADINYVTVHKNHVWLGIKDLTAAYYLPLGAQAGAATPLQLGDKFAHGGYLAGIFNWTVDGGEGVDDIIVFVSKAGDVVVYTGSGPAESDWGMKGVWFIGKIPNTSRFGTEQGGSLYLLSAYGVVSMADLLQGVDTALLQAATESTGTARKIAGLIRTDMVEKIDDRGWEIAQVPSLGGVVINTPTTASDQPIQYYYNLATQGWSLMRDVPMACFAEFEDKIYLGTDDDRIFIMDNNVDNELITAVDDPNGDAIQFSILTTFSTMDAEGVFKRVKMIRPDFLAIYAPSSESTARYDFDVEESLMANLTDQSLIPSGVKPTGVWDTSKWDAAVWGSNVLTNQSMIGGAWGYGRYVAVATKGESRSPTRLIGWDVIYDTGGPML